uniref:Ig-like domain-containing protein n=1 Tax=Timema poppense TaxID=170557 RepID=A0A7R9GVZ5_TIMPO|nr:unnamed protein product [Timema poppensis]
MALPLAVRQRGVTGDWTIRRAGPSSGIHLILYLLDGPRSRSHPPQIKSIGSDRLTTASLFSQATFTCSAEGNPKPNYQWLQKLPTPEGTVLLRSSEPRLYISNVTYDYQGEYVCKATNVIGGTERFVQSEAISVQVVGAPQVLRQSGGPEVVVARGQDALLRLTVCADPRPRRTAWEWGSLKLEAGADLGRYKAEELAQDEREDCYEARLHVSQVDSADSRYYFLAVENDRGQDRHAVHLAVREPVSMATLVSLAAGSLLLLLLVISFTVYAVRREKCCFALQLIAATDALPEIFDNEEPIKSQNQPSQIIAHAL